VNCFERIKRTNERKCPIFATVAGAADEVEYRLIRDLLRNYDHRIRPSLNASEPLNVTFGLALAQIIDVVRKVARWRNG